jgi:2'-5' RNA ligase superfamily
MSKLLAQQKKINEYELVQYQLVIQPDAILFDKIMLEKEQFGFLYGNSTAPHRPHIKVAGFNAKEAMEPTLIKWIQRICSNQCSFTVTLNNYGGFPEHTIYLRVLNAAPFQQLSRQLHTVDEFIQSYNCPPLRVAGKPYLGVAKKLPVPVYNKALFDYAQREFNESFTANEMLLLKKYYDTDAFKMVNVFRFLPANLAQKNAVA